MYPKAPLKGLFGPEQAFPMPPRRAGIRVSSDDGDGDPGEMRNSEKVPKERTGPSTTKVVCPDLRATVLDWCSPADSMPKCGDLDQLWTGPRFLN